MTPTRAVPAASIAMLAAIPAARAEETAGAPGTLGLGLQLGTALVVLLAVLIGVSVVAKLLIVFGVVPRQPETGFHAMVHAMANFVGGLTSPRQRRRETVRRDDR